MKNTELGFMIEAEDEPIFETKIENRKHTGFEIVYESVKVPVSDAEIEGLIAQLQAEDGKTRLDAAGELAAIHFASDIQAEAPAYALIQILQDKDEHEWVRTQAAWALGRLGVDAAIEPLIHALQDEYHEARREAAKALGWFRTPCAIEALRRVAETDENEWVRQEAVYAIRDIQKQEDLPHTNKWRYESGSHIHRSVKKVLEPMDDDCVVTPCRLRYLPPHISQGATPATDA